MSRPLVIILVVLSAVGIIALAAYKPSQPPNIQPDIQVGVTMFPLYDIVRNIAGDTVGVALLLPANAGPHTYEPTPSDVAAIKDARVIYRIGFGLDDWATRIANAKTDVLTLSADMTLRVSNERVTDPHYWLTITNAKRIATLAARDLSSHFPQYRTEFQTNLVAYLALLDDADAQIKTTINGMTNKNIVTMHDEWYYFAESYGLTIVGTFETRAAEEPSPQHLAALAAAMNDAGVRTIYVDAGESDAALSAFAADNGYTLRTVDGEGATYASYIDLMLANARIFSENQ